MRCESFALLRANELLMAPFPLVTLTTDFGSHSTYVAQLKGILFGLRPDVKLVDVTHEIQPQQVDEAGWVVEQLLGFYPPETIHLVVVDPGVGTSRRIVLIRLAKQTLVGPDNGLFTRACNRFPVERICFAREDNWTPDGRPVAPTFHGRDRMAPLVASLLSGMTFDQLGDSTSLASMVQLSMVEPLVQSDQVVGRVEWIDRFGNLITNIKPDDLSGIEASWVEVLSRRGNEVKVSRPVTTYGQSPVGTVVFLWGSTGFLEVAVVNGHAASTLSVERGAGVKVHGRSRGGDGTSQ